MAKKELTLVLRLKNMIARELHAASQAVRKFGHGLKVGAEWAAKAFTGLAAGIALAMRRAEEFGQQAAQVVTLIDIPLRKVKSEVRKVAAEFGMAKDDLTKGLYDAVSARIPKENAFEFLRTAAKAATAGAGTTAEAVNILTTTLNAFKIPAGEAGKVADVLFTTVRLGKTTLSELAHNFAIVAPVAAATGVKFEEVAAAMATITAQGTPTDQAATQIRQAIIAMNEVLGDGWARVMTLQEGMMEMARRAGGSQVKLKELAGRVEGMLGILQMTGAHAQGAAADLAEMGKAAGETDRAFSKANPERTLSRVQAALDNIVLTLGDAALEAFGPSLERAARAAATLAENIASFMDTEKFREIADTIDGVIAAIAAGGEQRTQALGAVSEVIKSSFAVAAEYIATKLYEVAPKIGHAIGAAAKAVMANVFQQKEIKETAKGLGIKTGFWTGAFGDMGDLSPKDRERISAAIYEKKQKELLAELGLASEGLADGESAAQMRLDNALEALRKIGMETPRTSTPRNAQPPITPPSTPITQGMKEQVDVATELADMFDEIDAERPAAIQREIDLTREKLDELRKVAKEEQGEIDRENHIAQLEEKAATAAEKFEKMKELAAQNATDRAKKTAQERETAAAAKRIAARREESDATKAAQLRERQSHGWKLNQRDKDFLAARGQIEFARKGLGAAGNEADKMAKAAADAAKPVTNRLDTLNEEVKRNNKRLQQLLVAAGR